VNGADRRAREAAFFDAATDPDERSPERPDCFVGDLLDKLPTDLRGKQVLELGCGTGQLSGWLAERGATVVGVDVSHAALSKNRHARTVLAAAEQLPFADSSFDLIVGSLILHHLPVEPTARELRRVLADQGRALFSENLGLNPLLRCARKHLTGRWGIPRLGTDDEKPLDQSDLRLLRQHFNLSLSCPDFLFFQLLDRQVFGYQRPAINRLCIRLDRWIHRGFPALRHYSFRGTVILERSSR